MIRLTRDEHDDVKDEEVTIDTERSEDEKKKKETKDKKGGKQGRR